MRAGRPPGSSRIPPGNHAQALALAGQLLGVPVTIVMPRTAPAVKRAATEGYGARIVLCEPTLESRESTVAAEIAAHGYTLVHPFNDWDVIAGQGTAALELLEQAGPLDVVIAPVGGGGLLSGTALARKGTFPRHEGRRGRARERRRRPPLARDRHDPAVATIPGPSPTACGPRSARRPSPSSRRHVDAIVTATEAEIIDATRFVWERIKIVIEPSSAVVVAPLLNGGLDVRGRRVGVILSGGNVDVEPFFRMLAEKWL